MKPWKVLQNSCFFNLHPWKTVCIMCSLIGSLLILAITKVIPAEEGTPRPEEHAIRKVLQGHKGKWRNFVTDINWKKWHDWWSHTTIEWNEMIVSFLSGCVSDRGHLDAPIEHPHVPDRPPDAKGESPKFCKSYIPYHSLRNRSKTRSQLPSTAWKV